MERDLASLESFEAKWTEAHPELGLALTFVAHDRRAARSAFACLGFELAHAAFSIRDAEPAAVKLQWWAEEFARTVQGEARHPLTRVLADHASAAKVPLAEWQSAIVGALMQRDAEPAPDADRLLEGYERLYAPLAAIECRLFGQASSPASGALARSLAETAALADVLRAGRLPLPLDLLARHRLGRGDLADASAARSAALREWMSMLQARAGALARAVPQTEIAATSLAATRARARRAARAPEPLTALAGLQRRLPLAATWSAWRAARRSRR